MSWSEWWNDFISGYKNIWSDKYQFGDVLKTIAHTFTQPTEYVKNQIGIPTVGNLSSGDVTNAQNNGLSVGSFQDSDAINEQYRQALQLQYDYNMQSNLQAQEFERQQVQEQRAWEEHLANTSLQRRMADAEAAGLNPYYLVSGSLGADTPSSSIATGKTSSVSMPNTYTATDYLKNLATIGALAALIFKFMK